MSAVTEKAKLDPVELLQAYNTHLENLKYSTPDLKNPKETASTIATFINAFPDSNLAQWLRAAAEDRQVNQHVRFKVQKDRIKPDDTLEEVKVVYKASRTVKHKAIEISTLFEANKETAIIVVPGAFTGTCDTLHLPDLLIIKIFATVSH
jgi:hypothetical protein